MARYKDLTLVATSLLKGSCITNLEVERRTKTYAEIVNVKNANGSVVVVSKQKLPLVSEPDTHAYRTNSVAAETMNGLQYQGKYNTGDDEIPFYGSEDAYRKLLAL